MFLTAVPYLPARLGPFPTRAAMATMADLTQQIVNLDSALANAIGRIDALP